MRIVRPRGGVEKDPRDPSGRIEVECADSLWPAEALRFAPLPADALARHGHLSENPDGWSSMIRAPRAPRLRSGLVRASARGATFGWPCSRPAATGRAELIRGVSELG